MGRHAAFGALLSILFASSALAQRTFVSAQSGSDSNPCSVTSPCRTLAAAIAAVAAGGEVVVLDSGGYGPFTIAKAVTVESPNGIYAGVSATSGDGIDVSAGASDIVVLRGLTLYGFSGARYGIFFVSGGALHIESCIVDGFPSQGIYQNSDGSLYVTDTTVRNGGIGIALYPHTASTASIIRCLIQNNSNYGFRALDGVTANIRDSVSSSNLWGFVAGGHITASELNLENCLATNNSGYGIGTIDNLGIIRVAGSTVTDNGMGLYQAGTMTLASWGNNHVAGNATDITGVITALSNH
jgi:hypothetical protein